MRFITLTIRATICALLLAGTTACVQAQSAPTMLDYSYIPPAQGVPVGANYGINDF